MYQKEEELEGAREEELQVELQEELGEELQVELQGELWKELQEKLPEELWEDLQEDRQVLFDNCPHHTPCRALELRRKSMRLAQLLPTRPPG
jgi:hypothetical protein